MHIVAAPHTESWRANLWFVPSDSNELSAWKQGLRPVLLGAIACNELDSREADNIFDFIEGPDNFVNGIGRRAMGVLVADFTSYLDARRVSVTARAADGHLTSAQLSEERALLREAAARPEPAVLTSDDGAADMAEFKEGRIVPFVGQVSETPFAELAAELGATHVVGRHEIMTHPEHNGPPMILSDYRHHQLGRFNEAEEFIPIATVLDTDHPVMGRDNIQYAVQQYPQPSA